MESNNSPKSKRATSKQPRLLTQSEIESLQREMKEDGVWMMNELKRRKEEGDKDKTPGGEPEIGRRLEGYAGGDSPAAVIGKETGTGS